jgi:hypothetical protein
MNAWDDTVQETGTIGTTAYDVTASGLFTPENGPFFPSFGIYYTNHTTLTTA